MSDMRVLLRNIETISHELAHLLFLTEDNTLNTLRQRPRSAKRLRILLRFRN